MIVATTQVCLYFLAGSLVNLLGQKMLLSEYNFQGIIQISDEE